jgi:hypothetical protein
MADEAIGEAAAATAAEGGIVLLAPNPEAEAAEQAEAPPQPVVAPVSISWPDMDLRIAALEESNLMLAQQVRDLSLALDSRAMVEHDHPADEDLQMLAEEFKAIRETETAPRRGKMPSRGWLRRAGRGG